MPARMYAWTYTTVHSAAAYQPIALGSHSATCG